MKLASDTNYAITLNPEDDYTMKHAFNTNIATQYDVNIAVLLHYFKFNFPINTEIPLYCSKSLSPCISLNCEMSNHGGTR